MDWDGHLEWYNLILVIFYLVMIALGFGSAWRRWRWLGLLPLVFSVGYSIATAIGRFSGWRYDLPADWVWYFYFGIGFAELLFQAALVLGAEAEQVFRAERREDSNVILNADEASVPGNRLACHPICFYWLISLVDRKHRIPALRRSISSSAGGKDGCSSRTRRRWMQLSHICLAT